MKTAGAQALVIQVYNLVPVLCDLRSNRPGPLQTGVFDYPVHAYLRGQERFILSLHRSSGVASQAAIASSLLLAQTLCYTTNASGLGTVYHNTVQRMQLEPRADLHVMLGVQGQ